jgi:FKBP-type peptidyl-prolyl cis-trans isomerase FklB
MKNFMAGFVSGTTGKQGLMTVEQAQTIAQTKMQEIRARELEKTYGSNKKEGENFLAKNAKKDGVKTLKSGVQYRVIKEGTGAIPADTSLVKVHYEGRLLNDSVFDSSYKRGEPITLRCNQTIKGWTDAMVHMPAGSIWEVYIPQDLAYGEREQGIIKPFSVLVFKIELLEVNPKK